MLDHLGKPPGRMFDPTPFFYFIGEREKIYQRRLAGGPPPWSDDPVFRDWRFCNVFREQDKTTRWFRENVREPLRASRDVLIATVVFRWFNRITTGEAIFKKSSAFDDFLVTGDANILKTAILDVIGPKGPHVTGAYRVHTPKGKGVSKLGGVIGYIGDFRRHFSWQSWPSNRKLSSAWYYLKQFSGLGDLTAYEIVTDLRHTDMLCDAPDIMSWANAGPGAIAGLNTLHGRPINYPMSKERSLAEMQELLMLTQLPENWAGPPMEMRDIEHSLCETSKMLASNWTRGVSRNGSGQTTNRRGTSLP